MSLPLHGIKVLEIGGLAPAPFAGLMLADFGADVVRIDRVDKDGNPQFNPDNLARGKRSIAIDLKSEEGRTLFKSLVEKADVLIEPFRPGVMERLGLGPDILCALNSRLIYARMTGFGQGGDGKVGLAAGHDINYIAVSGALSTLRAQGQAPQPPINLLGDFAGGGLMCAMGILIALIERARSGTGQVIDASMIDGASYVSSFVYRAHMFGQWENELDTTGTNLLDGGAPFYSTYLCKCGAYVSVGPLEGPFYKQFIAGLGLNMKELPAREDRKNWPKLRKIFGDRFLEKTRDEWASIYYGTDACVFPVLSIREAQMYPHNQQRGTFVKSADTDGYEPRAAPVLSRTPAAPPRASPSPGEHSEAVMNDYGISKGQIAAYLKSRAVSKL